LSKKNSGFCEASRFSFIWLSCVWVSIIE
jgi:hypothetical protein